MISPPRNLLCLITSGNDLANIDELTRDVWSHFDGLCAVVHRQGPDTDAVLSLLRARAGCGFVKEETFLWHHSHAMNHWLLDPRILPMDACWIRDSSERFNPEFTRDITSFSAHLLEQGVFNLGHQGKLLMLRRWYGQQFVNGLHWGCSHLHGATASIEQLFGGADERLYAYSVRNEKRPPTHRLMHEVRYCLDYGLNGNHLALFHKDAASLDAAYSRLHVFTSYLRGQGVVGAEQYTKWLVSTAATPGGLPLQVKDYINSERPFRNHYRFYALGHTHEAILLDEDTWRIDLSLPHSGAPAAVTPQEGP